ncbi:hypothetical protein FOA52_012285, partial [Chlamydomonas sp. UWO 241]
MAGGSGSGAVVNAAFAREIVAEEADTPPKPSDYVMVDNLRLVSPYYFDFKCFVKQRWVGMNLVQLFSQEFPMLTEEYYTRAFNAGRLRVEGHPGIALNTPLSTSMCVRHLIHRHEPPVLAGSVTVLSTTDEWVAVLKPACMPVHTVGQYRKNTVMGVLQAEHPELGMLYPTYRLDKPVSGLLLLARSSAGAGRMRKNLEERACSKSYLARVTGVFPGAPADSDVAVTLPPGVTLRADGWVSVDVPLSWDAKYNHVSAVPLGGEGGDAGPSTGSTNKGGKSAAGDPKESQTEFRLRHVAPDRATSVVECRPKTGRTHQIRVHLQ